MLVRAHVAANTDIPALSGGPLSEEELQEGLMAGFGARARRRHAQRQERKRSARVSTQQGPPVTHEAEGSAHVSQSSEDDEQTHHSAASSHAAAGIRDVAGGAHCLKGCGQFAHGSTQQQDMAADAAENSPDMHSCDEAAPDEAQSSGSLPACKEPHSSSAPKASVTELGRGGHFWHGERYSSPLSRPQDAWQLHMQTV